MNGDAVGYFITWTTYGSWLPGDERGWRKRIGGPQSPRPRLKAWCRDQMTGDPILLSDVQRQKVHAACEQHCEFRGWKLHEVNARTNHVHVVVSADAKPQKVRDQLKANATRTLRQPPQAVVAEKLWTSGGDCQALFRDEDLEEAIRYVRDAQ